MRALVDTHTLLWFLNDDTRLSEISRAFMKSGQNDLLVGVGCCWELAIKCGIGKITLDKPFEQFLWSQLRSNAIEVLGISEEHLNRVGSLPLHHRDPFDRLLVAQAIVEGVSVVSADTALDAYGIERIW